MITLLEPQLLAPERLSAGLMIAVIFATRWRVIWPFLPWFSLPFPRVVMLSAQAVALPRRSIVVAYRASDPGDLAGRRVGPLAVSGANNRWPVPTHPERAAARFARSGPNAIMLGYFLPGLRSVLKGAARGGSTPRSRFAAGNLVGSGSGAAVVLLAGISSGRLRDRRTSGCP